MKTKKYLFFVMTTLTLCQLAHGQALPSFEPTPFPVPGITNDPPAPPLVAIPTINDPAPPAPVAALTVTSPVLAPPAAPPTGVILSSLTQADLEVLARLLQVSLTNQVLPAAACPTPALLERFARVAQTNRIVVDARWKTSLGDGEYLETRTIEAETAGAQQAVPEVPTVAELVSALTTARTAQQIAATPPARIAGVPTTPAPNQVARGKSAQQSTTTPLATSAAAELKHPVSLQDGKLVELPGQWLYTKDGTPVFVQSAPPQPEPAIADNSDGSEEPFVLLAPAGGTPVQQQYSNGDVANAVYPSRRYHSDAYGAGGGFYGNSFRNGGGPPISYNPRTGAYRLEASRPLGGNYYYRADGSAVLRANRSW